MKLSYKNPAKKTGPYVKLGGRVFTLSTTDSSIYSCTVTTTALPLLIKTLADLLPTKIFGTSTLKFTTLTLSCDTESEILSFNISGINQVETNLTKLLPLLSYKILSKQYLPDLNFSPVQIAYQFRAAIWKIKTSAGYIEIGILDAAEPEVTLSCESETMPSISAFLSQGLWTEVTTLLPAAQNGNSFAANLGGSRLEKLSLQTNLVENEVTLNAEGNVMGIEAGILFTNLNMGGNNMMLLKLTVLKPIAEAVPDILYRFFGLQLSDEVIACLPKMKFALHEISLSQQDKSFYVSGEIQQGTANADGKEGYRMGGEIGIGWDGGWQFDLVLKADEYPLKLSALAADLPFAGDIFSKVLPETVARKISDTEFYNIEFSFDTASTLLHFHGVACLFGKFYTDTTFTYSQSAGVEFTADIDAEVVYLKDLLQLLGIDTSDKKLPFHAVGIALTHIRYSQSEKTINLNGRIETDKGIATVEFSINFADGIELNFDYRSGKDNYISIGDALESTFPAGWVQQLPVSTSGNNFINKLKESGLTALTLNADIKEGELAMSAAGNVLGLEGNMAFTLLSPFGKPVVGFSIGGSESNADSIANLLKKHLCIELKPETELLMPKMKVALTQLSYEQMDGRFFIAGVAMQGTGLSTTQEGYKLKTELGIEWNNGLSVDLLLDAEDAPVSIASMLTDLNIPTKDIEQLVPQKILSGIKFYKLSLNVDSSVQKVAVLGIAEILGSIVTSNFEIFRKNNNTFLALSTEINYFGLNELIAITGSKALPDGFPKVAFKDILFAINTETKNIRFKGESASPISIKLDKTEASILLGIDVEYSAEKKLQGFLRGNMQLAGCIFDAQYAIGTNSVISFKLSGANSTEVDVKTFINQFLPGVSMPKELPELKVKNLSGELNLSKLEFNITGSVNTEWAMIPTVKKIKTDIAFKLGRKLKAGTVKTYLTDCSFALTMATEIAIAENISLTGFNIAFSHTDNNWLLGGEIKTKLFDSGFAVSAEYTKQGGNTSVSLKAKPEGNPLKISKLLQLCSKAPLELPEEIKNIDLSVAYFDAVYSSDKNFALRGELSLTNKPAVTVGDESFKINSFGFNIQKADNSTKILLMVKGHNLPKLASIDAQLKTYEFTFEVNAKQGEKAEWMVSGKACIEAFSRLLYFSANASSSGSAQQLIFLFESSKPFITSTHFAHIPGVSPAEVVKSLNGGTMPANQQLPMSELGNDFITKLDDKYTAVQKNSIKKAVEDAQKYNQALITLPDVLNQNKTLCEINPTQFKFSFSRENGRFKSIDISIASDLKVYNTWDNQKVLFDLKNGTATTGYDAIQKQFYVTFSTDSLDIKPLGAITLIPGIKDTLISAFGESTDNHPKASAFAEMLEIKPRGFTFLKNDKNWNMSGGIRLALTEKLRVVDADIYKFVEELFPKTGNERYIEGQIGYDTKEGLLFVLENNNGLEIPNLMHKVAEHTNAHFKEDFKHKTGVDLDELTDLGNSFVILDRVRLRIAQEVSFDARIGIGLPSKLNDRLFSKTSKIHGLINTYDREKYLKANAVTKNGKIDFNAPFPDDNLLRASLRIGSDGISGQLEQFKLFNVAKIAKEFEGLLKEERDFVILDFNALTNDSKGKAAKLKIEKPEFKLDFKTCSFAVTGGVQLLSEGFRVPVRSMFKKMIALLPDGSFDTNELNKVADKFTESIALKSIDFYDAETGNLSIDNLLDFLKQFLLAEHQQLEIIPKEVLEFINNNSAIVSKLLPEILIESFAIKVPAGFRLRLEVYPDQTFSFCAEVPQPTKEQKKAGYSDCLQVIVPDTYGMYLNVIKLKKIGLGSALFNNAIRLDLSAELQTINLPELIPGAGMALLRGIDSNDVRLQHMLPDVKKFGQKVRVDNLLMFIFPQTEIPIPVPVFYDNFSLYQAGIAGDKSELAIRFPKPQFNIMEVLKGIGELVSFFKDKEMALPLKSYGVVHKKEEVSANSIIPTFYAGPVYYDIPGIIGYVKQADGSRKHIKIGFDDLKIFNPRDLFALVANTAKFGLRSVIEKQKLKIKIDVNRSEYPVNYLVKFLPESQRIGAETIVLFEIFEANYIWALSTPGEFREKVFPLIKVEQAKFSISGPTDTWTSDETLQIVPSSSTWSADQEGVVTMLKGGIKISDALIIDLLTITAITSGNGISTGMALRTQLAKLFDLELAGGIIVNPSSEEKPFGMEGKSSIKLLGKIPVMKGRYSFVIGTEPYFMFAGMLDLFPDELFMGYRSPIQLYTGTEKGKKSEIFGIINKYGINAGAESENGIVPAGIHFELGEFYLAGTTRIVSTAQLNEWEINLVCYDTILSLRGAGYEYENYKKVEFGISANKVIGIDRLIAFSGNDAGSGPSGRIAISYPNDGTAPVLNEFFLDGKFILLGMSSTARININQSGFAVLLSTDIGILQASLSMYGSNLNNINTFALNGNVGILNNLAVLNINANYTNINGNSVFAGNGTISFWGAERMQLTIEAGSDGNNPYFSGGGNMNLSVPGLQFNAPCSGSITKDKMHFNGSLDLKIGTNMYVGASGNINLIAEPGTFYLYGSLNFNAGIVAGMQASYSISKNNDILKLSGSTSTEVYLIPNIIKIGSSSALNLSVNESNQTFDCLELNGTTEVLGTRSGYNLKVYSNQLVFNTYLYTALADLSLTATTTNLSDYNSLRLSGSIDLAKINTALDSFYNSIGIKGKVESKISSTNYGIGVLSGTKGDIMAKIDKINFIMWMDSKWNRNGWDPDGFQYCVPPESHVEYWSESHWWWDAGKPRYSKTELHEVRVYYQYKRELGIFTGYPPRHDIARFVNGVLKDVNNLIYNIGRQFSDTFRQVINDIHYFVTDGILQGLNIDTTNLDQLNQSFNQGMNTLNAEADKWNNLLNRLLNYKLIEVHELRFSDQKINILESKIVNVWINYSVLGQQGQREIVLNLNDPGGSIARELRYLLPSELQRMYN